MDLNATWGHSYFKRYFRKWSKEFSSWNLMVYLRRQRNNIDVEAKEEVDADGDKDEEGRELREK